MERTSVDGPVGDFDDLDVALTTKDLRNDKSVWFHFDIWLT
jgi:hypothetical protein